jgi:hypothetical protein
MAAAKPKLIELAKSLKKGLSATGSEARSEMIAARISRLRSAQKMTPAEQKKIDLTAMTKQSDVELAAYFKGFEDRENVIDARIHGTTKALSLASLSRMTAEKRIVRLEAEARADMGLPMDEAQKKEMGESKELPNHNEVVEHESPDAMLTALEGMLASHDQRDAVMAHVKKMMEMKHLGEKPAEHAAESEKKMSALAQNVNRLQTEFQDLINLVGESAGIKSAELE